MRRGHRPSARRSSWRPDCTLATDGESIPYVAGRGKDGALAAVTEAAELIDEIARRIEDTIASYLEEPGDGEAAAAA
jgi:hypothetical protein